MPSPLNVPNSVYRVQVLPRAPGLELPREEARHIAAHVFDGIILAGIIGPVPQNAFDAERVELGLERLAETRVVDPLPWLGVGWKRRIRLGVEQDRPAGRPDVT